MAQLSNSTIKEVRDAAFRLRGQSLVYRISSDTPNYKTGVVTESDSDTTIGDGTDDDPGALISTLDQQTIANSGGKYQVGDKLFRIRASDMPATPPNKATHKIVYSSDEYMVYEYDFSEDTNVYDIYARKP